MILSSRIFFVGFFLLAVIAHGQTSYEKGKAFFERRAEKSRDLTAKKRFVNKSIKHLSKADQPEAIALLLRAYEFKGTFTRLSDDQREKTYKKAVDLGQESIDSYPTHLGIKYYYAVNLGRWGQAISIIKAHKEGITDEMRDILIEVDSRDSTFAEAGPKRLLGGMHLKIPKVPFVLTWPSKERAMQLLRLAYLTSDENPANVKLFAEALMEQGEESQAISLLRKLADNKPRPKMYLEDLRAILEAQKLLNNI